MSPVAYVTDNFERGMRTRYELSKLGGGEIKRASYFFIYLFTDKLECA